MHAAADVAIGLLVGDALEDIARSRVHTNAVAELAESAELAKGSEDIAAVKYIMKFIS